MIVSPAYSNNNYWLQVYLERLVVGLEEMHVLAWSWRRQLLSCILLACKVLDDQAVWNADYCQLLKDVSVEDL